MSYAVESMPKWSARRSVQPAIEPVSLAEAKEHCKITEQDTDREVGAFIKSAREAVEHYLNRTLITTTWVLRMEELCGEIEIPYSPLLSVGSIVYDAADGTPTTLATTEYQVDIYSEPGRIKPAYSKFWPVPRLQYNSVRITYDAGYGPAGSDVPERIREGILIEVAERYHNRGDADFEIGTNSISRAAALRLYPFRLWWV